MRSFNSKTGRKALVAVLAVCWAGGVAGAQEADKNLVGQWENFLHYVLMARPDLAESYGKAILQANPDPRQLYELAEKNERSGATLARGMRNETLAPLIGKINALIDEGAKAVRMDPDEIDRWIKALAGTSRQYDTAKRYLVRSGEFAVPQIVMAMSDPKVSPLLRERIVTVLPGLGREGVRPLAEALAVQDPATREDICRALGKIGYAHAAPALKDMAESKDVLDRTRDVALGALAACAGKNSVAKSAAELHYELALKYYDGAESILPDSRYDTANYWYWQKDLGLTYKAVPRVVFNDAYAMREAARALAADSKFAPAVSLWLSANYRKEANLPQGAKDTTVAADELDAAFYGMALGVEYLQAVLARALQDGDVKVAVRAIQALSLTTGAENLVKPVSGGAQPLVAALSSSAREVRYPAAETLARALPSKPFVGDHLVVGVLVQALRQTSASVAAVADPDVNRRNSVKDMLRAAGLTVFEADTLGAALKDCARAGGADLIVLASDVRGPNVADAAAMVRQEAVTSRLPVIVVARMVDMGVVRDIAKGDELVLTLAEGSLSAAAVADVVKEALAKSAGQPLTADEAAAWAVRAAGCMQLLAETNNPVYDLTDATKNLIAALKDERPEVRVAAANALAVIRSADAQRALVELAADAAADESIRLAAFSAATKSVRLFGNDLTEGSVNAVIDMVKAKGSPAMRNAAAQLHGALDLPSEKIDLIGLHSAL